MPDKPVLIPAQTGQGKTYWASHGLYDYLKANSLTCLFLIQRTRTKEQLKKEFAGKEAKTSTKKRRNICAKRELTT